MINNINIEKLYNQAKIDYTSFNTLLNSEDKNLIKIINNLNIASTKSIFHKNNYDLNLISNMFRSYENELKNCFLNEKIEFQFMFKAYILLISIFIKLCTLYCTNQEKRKYINYFIKLLTESNNILKFTVPLEKKELAIINNLIGEQLYLFSHIYLVDFKLDIKEKDYIFEEYFYNLERISHGYELSCSTNFANNTKINKYEKYMIFLNNSSFLLLEMIYKLCFYLPKVDYFLYKKFRDSIDLFHSISLNNKHKTSKSINSFKNILLEEFILSGKYLNNNNFNNIINDKILILKSNTDVYKHFIDIIINSKELTT